MQTGTKISAVVHVTLVGWAFLGGAFRSEPLPFDVQDVSVISAEEFAALSAPVQTPELAQQPDAPQQPETPTSEVAVPEAPQPEPEQQQPDPVAEPEPEPVPDPVVEAPDPQVSEDTAVLVQPDPDPTIDLNPPGKRPKPRPVERVAPQPVAAPPPDATPDDVETPPVVTEEGAETPQPEQEQTAPEEATDQIVTEAEESDELAPLRSPRPPARRPTRPTTTQTAESEAAKPVTQTGVESALAEALAGAQEDVPLGPPLTGGEKEGLRLAMSRCWNVGALSSEALQTTVTVAFSMQRDGKPETGSIRMLDSSGGSASSAQQAYQAARRAIIRCGAKGYDLPAEKYGQWRDIEVTFNPERMRIK